MHHTYPNPDNLVTSPTGLIIIDSTERDPPLYNRLWPVHAHLAPKLYRYSFRAVCLLSIFIDNCCPLVDNAQPKMGLLYRCKCHHQTFFCFDFYSFAFNLCLSLNVYVRHVCHGWVWILYTVGEVYGFEFGDGKYVWLQNQLLGRIQTRNRHRHSHSQ